MPAKFVRQYFMVLAHPSLPAHMIDGPRFRTWCGMLLHHFGAGPAAEPIGVVLLLAQVKRLGARVCVGCLGVHGGRPGDGGVDDAVGA